MNKQIFLENLPKKDRGNKKIIDWLNCKGYEIEFTYKDVKGKLKILDYKGRYLYIEYLNNKPFKISPHHLKECKIGKLIGKHTNEFKYKINENLKNDIRDITIISMRVNKTMDKNNKKYNYKYYTYHCNRCGSNNEVVEGTLDKEYIGCPYCSNQKINNTNCVATTHPWVMSYLVNKEDAYKYSHGNSKDKVKIKCPICGREKYISLPYLIKNDSIGCPCSKGISYCERMMISILDQLGEDYIYQLTKFNVDWISSNIRYDFAILNKSIIIEMNGRQHYEDGFGKSVVEQKSKDEKKEELSSPYIDNYIVIECKKSNFDYIKNNILKNEQLKRLINMSNINWDKCRRDAESSLLKEICCFKNANPKMTPENISQYFKVNRGTVTKYLNKGNKLKLCNYNSRQTMRDGGKKGADKSIIKSKKIVRVFRDNIFRGEFESVMELERQSEKIFKIKLEHGSISRVCNGKIKQYKGYTFEYVR